MSECARWRQGDRERATARGAGIADLLLCGRNVPVIAAAGWLELRAAGTDGDREDDVPMPTLSIPPPYRGPTRGEATVAVSGQTVRACIDDAEARYPGIREQVLDARGEPHRFVRLFRNGGLLQGAALDATVEDEDEIAVVAAIAGG